MSIWSSLPEDVSAIDMNDPRADQYSGTGPEDVDVDVATTGGHDMIRLSAYHDGTSPNLDACLMITHDAARALIRNLKRAVGDH